MRLTRAVFATLALALFASCGGEPDSGEIRLDVEFHSMWWSESQMEGLDPDNPPAKRTEVVLQAWEYTDPIGVPNPDTVDIVATLHGVPEDTPVAMAARTRWKIGPLEDEKGAEWTAGDGLAAAGSRSKRADGAHVMRWQGIDLSARQRELFATGRWPWALEAVVTAKSPDGHFNAKATAILPILPAD